MNSIVTHIKEKENCTVRIRNRDLISDSSLCFKFSPLLFCLFFTVTNFNLFWSQSFCNPEHHFSYPRNHHCRHSRCCCCNCTPCSSLTPSCSRNRASSFLCFPLIAERAAAAAAGAGDGVGLFWAQDSGLDSSLHPGFGFCIQIHYSTSSPPS